MLQLLSSSQVTSISPSTISSATSTHLIDQAGAIADQYRFTAFGEELTTPQTTNPWRYSSKRTDSTGLVYFGRRYYHPPQGRWLTPDPKGFTDGPNLYAFVQSNPLLYVDHYGLDTEYNFLERTTEIIKGITLGAAYSLFRDNTSLVLHDAANEVLEMGSVVPRVMEEVQGFQFSDTGSKFFPMAKDLSPTTSYRAMGNAVHTGIDWLFSTDLSDRYQQGASPVYGEMTVGLIPLPGSGARLKAGKVGRSNVGKAEKFTSNNYRAKLKKYTSQSPSGKTTHAHHVFPQEFEEYFLEKGINVHSSKHMTWWEAKSHLANAKGYNKEWIEFFEKQPNASQAQILDYGKQLMKEYGLKVNY